MNHSHLVRHDIPHFMQLPPATNAQVTLRQSYDLKGSSEQSIRRMRDVMPCGKENKRLLKHKFSADISSTGQERVDT